MKTRGIPGIVSAIIALVTLAGPAPAQTVYSHTELLNNPNWQIAISDYGYSDYLGDYTPGLVGREYLSGEWGGAIGYSKEGHLITPQWLEPQFIYPDWKTNSKFDIVSPITITGNNAQNLPIAQSIIQNGDVRVTQTFEMIDTVTGVAMGTTAATASGGSSVNTNRYLLKQSYSITNISDKDMTNVQFFQFLHGLESTGGVYDNRNYAGNLAAYKYDVTLHGDSTTYVTDADGNYVPVTLRDYLGFQSSIAPSAFELGAYGFFATDNHYDGKPSDGVHLSVENNWGGVYAARKGNASYEPADAWVAGAQRYTLGSLAQGATATMDVLLSVRTASLVPATGGGGGGEGDTNPVDGTCRGGAGNVSGIDYHFDDLVTPGSLFAEYEAAELEDIHDQIEKGTFGVMPFGILGSAMQIWHLEFDGEFNGKARLTFAYDPSLLPTGFDESTLGIWHFNGALWEMLGGSVDTLRHLITVETTSFSPFALAINTSVPEPASLGTLALTTLVLVRKPRRLRG